MKLEKVKSILAERQKPRPLARLTAAEQVAEATKRAKRRNRRPVLPELQEAIQKGDISLNEGIKAAILEGIRRQEISEDFLQRNYL